MTSVDIINHLKGLANPKNVTGMARFGIKGGEMLGVSAPDRRSVSKQFLSIHKQELAYRHTVAQELWDSGIHEAMMMAADVDVPGRVTQKQMESWANDFDS